MNRKKLVILISVLLTLIIIFLFFFWFPASYKSNVKVNNHTVNAYKSDTEKFKVLVFSDLNLGYDYQVNNLEYLVKTINDQEPDVVLFNGDLLDNKNYNTKDNKQVITLLSKIKAVYGKFANLGELDEKLSNTLLSSSGFEILTNTSREINVNNNKFNLVSLSDNGKYAKALDNLSDESYNFVLVHNPNLISKLLNNKLDLIVSGHTLGGQYNLPIYGTIFNELKDIPYSKGYLEENGIQLYNSNGIGTRYSNMRLLAPSSIEVFIFK